MLRAFTSYTLRYTRYSATRQFFSATACTALHLLRRRFCTLVLFIYLGNYYKSDVRQAQDEAATKAVNRVRRQKPYEFKRKAREEQAHFNAQVEESV